MLSSFHPTVQSWFKARFAEPSPAQALGWAAIHRGAHTLISAPTGSGKTLAGFLIAIDRVLRLGRELPDRTQILYVSPLKALGNDVQKNLAAPLAEMRAMDGDLPEVRVLVRSGDTSAADRAAMKRRHPHILVTTPESFYLLLTSAGGRQMLCNVKSVIVDEIHAVLGDKRGSHLSLSLERLVALAGEVQRIGLSATQKPLSAVGEFLVGPARTCELVDVGHVRELDFALELPRQPLSAVCSSEVWNEIYERICELALEHKTTLIFVNTRKLAERVSRQLSELLGEGKVGCHHSSLSRDRRLEAELKLKAGVLRAMVATSSLELGIDIGDIDLVVQVGSTRSIATFLQRIGRSGHALSRVPKGRVFPLTRDELVEAAGLFLAMRRKNLDVTAQPRAPLDILAQQIIAECAAREWNENELFDRVRGCWPYRALERGDFDTVVRMHCDRRDGLLHRDGVQGRLLATRRARLVALTCGGAIPDNADYQVILEPEGTIVGSVNEDFAIESSIGDVFQLGNSSWKVLKIERGALRVADARGVPPSLPFWFGEAPARTRELSAAISEVREHGTDADWLVKEAGISMDAAREISEYVAEGVRVLGVVPTKDRLVLERFFDESGGMQLVLHSPLGGRINRAFGLALRKCFCRSFGFELQAAANEDAIVISLGPQHSFELAEVFDYLSPDSVQRLLEQALLVTPMFTARWRWNSARSFLVERFQSGKKVPAPLLRMKAEDLLVKVFPKALACGETLPPGDIDIPMDHPIVRQTVEDCLYEAMDLPGLLELLERLRSGSVERIARDTQEPSVFAEGILNARPYGFLDDAPLEERRTQAVQTRRTAQSRVADPLSELDAEAVARVREESWPCPRDAEELHEALMWIGYLTPEECASWQGFVEELQRQGRVVLGPGRICATEVRSDPAVWNETALLRGRMEVLGPVHSQDPRFHELESEGVVLRVRWQGRQAWCNRRLLARIQRYTLEKLHKEIEPVSAAEFLRFLAAWQHLDRRYQLEGPLGLRQVLSKLSGFEIPAADWESSILPARVSHYRKEWLDQLLLGGEVVFGRLWGGGACALRSAPISFVLREELEEWLALGAATPESSFSAHAREVFAVLRSRGAMFGQGIARAANLLPAHVELGLGELIALGVISGDSFAGVRQMLVPPSRRRHAVASLGRWSLLRADGARNATALARETPTPAAEFVARKLLERTGVVFRRTLAREKQPFYWRDLLRALRGMELRGEVRGGRFVARFDGEQYALPSAIPLLRKIRKEEPAPPLTIAASDPLNFRGILTPDERVPATARTTLLVG